MSKYCPPPDCLEDTRFIHFIYLSHIIRHLVAILLYILSEISSEVSEQSNFFKVSLQG